MERVWLVETGEYEQAYIVGVFASPEAAVAKIKATYCKPYRVTWLEPVAEDDGDIVLTGVFERVLNYSTEHRAYFNISPYDVQN